MPTPQLPNNESNDTLRRIVARIKIMAEEERELLDTSQFDGLSRIVARKDQLAIELSRELKVANPGVVDGEARQLFQEAAGTLEANADLLRRHIAAVSEVAGLICNILVNANSDGTYTNNVSGRGYR
ncbi:MAG: hypothetical protein AB7L90_17495 [Hyphomicrobiaceae bacterium]